jgi:hypothetical protein
MKENLTARRDRVIDAALRFKRPVYKSCTEVRSETSLLPTFLTYHEDWLESEIIALYGHSIWPRNLWRP